MSIRTSLPFLCAFAAVVVSSVVVGCSSSSTPATPASDSGITPTDGGVGTDGSMGGGIAGPKEISITIVETASPMNTPLANVFVRAESPAGFLEAKTDAMGVAKFKVDPAKGPFDVTAAIAGYYAVSILGVTDSVPGNVILAQIGAMPSFKEFAVTGAITGATATNTLQIDAFDWQTVVTKAGAMTYATKFETINGITVPIPVAAIEVQPPVAPETVGTAVKGVLANSGMGAKARSTSTAMVIDIDMGAGVAATNSMVTINWPTAGILTGTLLKGIGSPVADMHIGSGIVEQITSAEPGAAMFVGIAKTSAPVNGVTTMTLQTFPGAMKPDIAGTEVSTVAPMKTATPTDLAALVYSHDLGMNASVTVGQIDTLAITGTSLDDAKFEIKSTGYDVGQVFVSNKAGMTTTAVWIIYVVGGKVAPRGLPHLPGGVKIGDLGGDLTSAEMSLQVTKYIPGANAAWDNNRTDQAHLVGNAAGTGLDPTFTRQ